MMTNNDVTPSYKIENPYKLDETCPKKFSNDGKFFIFLMFASIFGRWKKNDR